MVVWKTSKGLEFEGIEEVVEAQTREKAQRLLEERWVLLAVGVVQVRNKKGEMEGAGHYVFGRGKAV